MTGRFQVEDVVTQALEDRYTESFELWHHTARWRLLARVRRRVLWQDWLRAMNGYVRESWVGREAAEHERSEHGR